jgi:hypothetical protein
MLHLEKKVNMTKSLHNSLYYEEGRNGYIANKTVDNKIPNYYIGKYHGYEARKVIEDFDLSYNIGTSTTYLLRAGKKKEQGMTDTEKHIEDLQKAKNHIDFEIERLKLKYSV